MKEIVWGITTYWADVLNCINTSIESELLDMRASINIDLEFTLDDL